MVARLFGMCLLLAALTLLLRISNLMCHKNIVPVSLVLYSFVDDFSHLLLKLCCYYD